jgi:hypothetical protein
VEVVESSRKPPSGPTVLEVASVEEAVIETSAIDIRVEPVVHAKALPYEGVGISMRSAL